MTVVEKDGTDYRMIIGSLKKPKKWYMLGHNKDLATSRFDKLLVIMQNERMPKNGRVDMFCGSQLRTFAKGEGEQKKFTFMDEDSKAKYVLTKVECLELKESVERY